MSNEASNSVARKKEFGGFSSAISSEIKEKGDDGFGDKNAGHNGCKDITVYDFVGGSEVDDNVGNEKNDGGKNFDTKNVRKCGVVGFFGISFTKSVMVKTSKKSGI